MEEENVKRRKWPLARVTKIMPAADGVVRTLEVRNKNGTYTRPATRLFKLEDNGDL